MGRTAPTVNFPAHDGPVLRMGIGNVSTTACQNPPFSAPGAEFSRSSWLQDYTSRRYTWRHFTVVTALNGLLTFPRSTFQSFVSGSS